MTVTRQDIDFLVATARTAADVEIMPRFANLAAADIKTKALGQVDEIAVDTTDALVTSLIGESIGRDEIAQAVAAVTAK